MSNFTLDELTLIIELHDACAGYTNQGFPAIAQDLVQGVFTQKTIDDMVANSLLGVNDPNFKARVTTLANDLETGGQVVAAPPAFTADENHQMSLLLQSAFYDVRYDVKAAQHVGFWSDGQLADLRSYEASYHGLGKQSVAAIDALTADLLAGGQVLPDVHIVGIHHHG